MPRLILPGDPEFYTTLGTVTPPAAPDQVFIVRAGSLILEPASPDEVDEYLNGGEYDERLQEMGDCEEEDWIE